MTMYALTSLLPEKNTRISGKIQYLELDGSYTDILTLPFEKRIAVIVQKDLSDFSGFNQCIESI